MRMGGCLLTQFTLLQHWMHFALNLYRTAILCTSLYFSVFLYISLYFSAFLSWPSSLSCSSIELHFPAAANSRCSAAAAAAIWHFLQRRRSLCTFCKTINHCSFSFHWCQCSNVQLHLQMGVCPLLHHLQFGQIMQIIALQQLCCIAVLAGPWSYMGNRKFKCIVKYFLISYIAVKLHNAVRCRIEYIANAKVQCPSNVVQM